MKVVSECRAIMTAFILRSYISIVDLSSYPLLKGPNSSVINSHLSITTILYVCSTTMKSREYFRHNKQLKWRGRAISGQRSRDQLSNV